MARLRYLEERLAQLLREPRFNYFTHASLPQWQFAWSTERDPDGTYASWQDRPIGPGSRTGKATKMKRERVVYHKKRKDAKARAARLYDAAVARRLE